MIKLMNKTNPFVFVTMKDLNNATYTKSQQNIQEHITRLDEMSDSCTLIVDDLFLKSFNYKSPFKGNKFLYIFTDDKTLAEKVNQRDSKYMRFRPFKDLEETIKGHEQYKKMPLFFSGSSKLFNEVSKYIDSLLITQTHSESSNEEVLDKLENIERKFKLISSSSPCDPQLKNTKMKTIKKEVIMPNGMKMIETIENKTSSNSYFEFKTYRKRR